MIETEGKVGEGERVDVGERAVEEVGFGFFT